MPRLFVLVALLMALMWQSVAMARVGSSVNVLADAAHAALHWHGEGHHHHDDGTYHVGDGVDSAQHVASDHLSATMALLVSAACGMPAPESTPPITGHLAPAPDPTLDGLLRPPRTRA